MKPFADRWPYKSQPVPVKMQVQTHINTKLQNYIPFLEKIN